MRSIGGLHPHPIAYLRWMLVQMVMRVASDVLSDVLPVVNEFGELIDRCEAATPTRTMAGTTIFFAIFDPEAVHLSAYHILL